MMPNVLFCIPKRHVLLFKTRHFGMQNGAFGNSLIIKELCQKYPYTFLRYIEQSFKIRRKWYFCCRSPVLVRHIPSVCGKIVHCKGYYNKGQ